ncbi:MAG: hypothetical protein ACJA13_000046 [Paraglaciecola sp.]|jgi:hypothetical protein
MNMKTLLLSVLVVLLTTGCSGTYHAYYETLKIVFAEQPDAQMTLVEVQQSPVDVIAVKRGERPLAIMALAYLETGQHKWISNDKAMLIMEKGRIVRTLGLKENLLYLANTKTDPLKTLPSDMPKNPWQSAADYTGDQYGYPLESTFSPGESDKLHTLTLNIDTVLFVEKVSYLAPANFMRFNRNWHNYYWYDKKSGELLKIIQKFSPLAEPLQITYLSRIARLNHSLADKQ